MLDLPATPGTSGGIKCPVTPRTLAFNALGGLSSGKGKKGRVEELRANAGLGPSSGAREANAPRELPLRHHIAMGEETYTGK